MLLVVGSETRVARARFRVGKAARNTQCDERIGMTTRSIIGAAKICVFVLLLAISISPQAKSQPSSEAVEQWELLSQQLVDAYQAGDYVRGVELAEQSYALALAVLGPRDPRTLISLDNLAGLYVHQGRYGEAEPLYGRALQLSQEVLGEAHPQTLSSLNQLATLYESQDRSLSRRYRLPLDISPEA